MNITKKPNYTRYAMNRAMRLIIADLFSGADKFTILKNAAGTASIGVKCGKTYISAFDFIYHEKRVSIENTVAKAVEMGKIEKRNANKVCAFIRQIFGGNFNYARAAFYASVLSRIVFGDSVNGICAGIMNLARNGAEIFAETRRAELEEHYNFIMSPAYAAAWHGKRANHFRFTSEVMAKKAEMHSMEASKYAENVSVCDNENEDFGDESFMA